MHKHHPDWLSGHRNCGERLRESIDEYLVKPANADALVALLAEKLIERRNVKGWERLAPPGSGTAVNIDRCQTSYLSGIFIQSRSLNSTNIVKEAKWSIEASPGSECLSV